MHSLIHSKNTASSNSARSFSDCSFEGLAKGERAGQFVTLASGYADDDDALPIRTDAKVVAATLKAGESAQYPIGRDRKAYLVPATGAIRIDDVQVNARDGAAISDMDVIHVTAIEDSEIVLVDAA